MEVKLPMSNEEIVSNYKQAAYPNKQIGILAELNACSKRQIKSILTEAGIIPDTKERKLGEWDKEAAMRLYDEGKIDREIAAEIGVSNATILVWRKANNLPAHGRRRNRKVDNMTSVIEGAAEQENADPVMDQKPKTANEVTEIIKNAHMQIKAVKEPTELMKVAEMTFQLLEKIWERI